MCFHICVVLAFTPWTSVSCVLLLILLYCALFSFFLALFYSQDEAEKLIVVIYLRSPSICSLDICFLCRCPVAKHLPFAFFHPPHTTFNVSSWCILGQLLVVSGFRLHFTIHCLNFTAYTFHLGFYSDTMCNSLTPHTYVLHFEAIC